MGSEVAVPAGIQTGHEETHVASSDLLVRLSDRFGALFTPGFDTVEVLLVSLLKLRD